MWKLWHKLFGWDYVLLTGWMYERTRRIQRTPNGMEYAEPWGCGVGERVFLNDNRTDWRVTHLTRQIKREE